MIQENRLINEFIELIKVSSESKNEANICNLVENKLQNMGIKVFRNNVNGSNGFNLIAKINSKNQSPVFLNAHFDTVITGGNIKPIIENGIIKSDGTTILGADDKAGIAVILEVLRVLKSNKISHPPIDVVFTVCEEIGMIGAKNLDYSLIDAKYGYSFDSCELNSVIQAAPSYNHIFIKIYGIESHAGVAPEKGISAIEIASKAIANIKFGKIDNETTSNIGIIKGGNAINIVAGYVETDIEVRSHNEDKLITQTNHIIKTFREIAKTSEKIIDGEKISAKIEEKVVREYTNFYIATESPIIQKVISDGKQIGIDIQPQITCGGSDANIFNKQGIETVILGTGMQKVHTKQEFIKIKDLILCANLLLELLKTNNL